MRLQDQIVKQTQRAMDDVIRSVDALPTDKRDWAPEGGRSALSQLREIAMVPHFYITILKTGAPPAFDDHAHEMPSLTTVDECRTEAMKATSELCRMIREFPDSDLEKEITLPFNGGMVVTMADLLGLHYWNTVYHLGQINFIQTLLGDKEMH